MCTRLLKMPHLNQIANVSEWERGYNCPWSKSPKWFYELKTDFFSYSLDMNTLPTYSINISINSSMISSNLSKIKTSAIWTNEKIIFYKWSRKYKGCPTFATKKWSKRPAQSITVIVISQIPYRVKRVVCFCSKTI